MKTILALLCTSVLVTASAYAGPSQSSCDVIREEIIPLRVPNFDVPILWKKVLGSDGPDVPVDLIPLADGGFVMVGQSAKYDKDKGMGPLQLYMTRLDINGKVIWEKQNPIKGFVGASDGVAIKDRLAVLSAIQVSDQIKTAQLDYFDGLGQIKTTKVFSDSVYNLIPEGIASTSNSTSLTIALWAVNRKNPDDNFTILKKISADGKDIATRQYLPGVPNHLESFQKTSTGDLIGSGQITQDGGMKQAWIFGVDGESGNLNFQRPYGRGIQSNLRNVVEDVYGNFVAIGDSIPSDSGLRAAWIMKIDPYGNPIWQRYVQGKYAFSGRDISVTKDGRILALINGRPVDSNGGREHVRLLTFTPQGELEGDEALIEGANAQGVDLLVRDESRIMTGVTQSGLGNFPLAKDQKTAGYDYWILGLPKLSSFKDPCGDKRTRDTFDEGF